MLVALLISGLVRPAHAWATPAVLLPQVSLAASGPSLAVVVVALDAKAKAQGGLLQAAGEAAAARAGRFKLLAAPDAFNPAAARLRRQKLELGRKKSALGKQNLDDLDNVKATEAFTDALAAFREADSTTAFTEYVDALVLRAASHATGGENGPAKKDLESVLALNPRAELSPTYFSPDLIKYAEAQRKLAATNHGELTLSTTPSGAQVWVDGAYQGTSPLTVAGLAPGKHLVAALGAGTQLKQAELGLGQEELALEPAELAAAWKRAVALVTSDPEGPQRDVGGRELAKALSVDQLLLVEARKSVAGEQLELVAVRLDATDGHNWAWRTTTLNPGKGDALAQFFDLAFLKDTPRDGRSPVTHYKEGSSERALLSYGLLGLGVAGVASGAVFGFMASDRASAWRATKQTDVLKSNGLKSQGQTFALVADISFLVGIAAAATGTALLLTNKGNATDAASRDDDSPRRKEQDKKPDDRGRRDEDKKPDDRGRRDEDKKPDDRGRREEDKKPDDRGRREEDERKKADEARREDKRRADEADRKARDAAAEEKKRDEESKKLTKKQREEEERKRKEEEARAAAEEKKRDEEAKKQTKKQRDEEERKRKEDEARSAAEERKAAEAARKNEPASSREDKNEAEKRRKEEDDRRRIEEDRRKKEEEDKKKKKEEDHDDLRNY